MREASEEPLDGPLDRPPTRDMRIEEDGRMEASTAAAFGLFGREDALGEFRDALADGGSAVAVGDPGVGKSSVLRVAGQLGQRSGRRVLSVTPTQFERGLPFAGLAELTSQIPEGADSALPDPQ